MRAIDRRSDAIETAEWRFPQYTATEAAADRALHLFALPAATVAVGWLCLAAIPTADAEQTIACLIYGCGLIGMLIASAAYNLCPPGRTKELLRRIDHAMIFVMIAGTCTPFTLSAFPASIGLPTCILVWLIACCLPFHNVAWHGLVLLGAGLHWAAVANQVVNWRPV